MTNKFPSTSKSPVNLPLPLTSRSTVGVTVQIPARLFVASTYSALSKEFPRRVLIVKSLLDRWVSIVLISLAIFKTRYSVSLIPILNPPLFLILIFPVVVVFLSVFMKLASVNSSPASLIRDLVLCAVPLNQKSGFTGLRP